MFNGNPHAPSTSWLETIATDEAYGDAAPGDEGTDTFDRGDDGIFEVTVRCVADVADGQATTDVEVQEDGIRLSGDLQGECLECDVDLAEDDTFGGLVCPDCGADYASIFKITSVSRPENDD